MRCHTAISRILHTCILFSMSWVHFHEYRSDIDAIPIHRGLIETRINSQYLTILLRALGLASSSPYHFCDIRSFPFLEFLNLAPSIRVIGLDVIKKLTDALVLFYTIASLTSWNCNGSTFALCSSMIIFNIPCTPTVTALNSHHVCTHLRLRFFGLHFLDDIILPCASRMISL
jgi:hypothetical protein